MKRLRGAREYAHNLSKDKKNLGFINKGITPEGVDSLPNTDIVLMFSVYHYWYREFGKEAAEKCWGRYLERIKFSFINFFGAEI